MYAHTRYFKPHSVRDVVSIDSELTRWVELPADKPCARLLDILYTLGVQDIRCDWNNFIFALLNPPEVLSADRCKDTAHRPYVSVASCTVLRTPDGVRDKDNSVSHQLPSLGTKIAGPLGSSTPKYYYSTRTKLKNYGMLIRM